MKDGTVVVVAAGEGTSAFSASQLAGPARVIAADGGLDRAQALGLQVDLALGDFDSVSEGGLAAAEAAGARVERHPATKDATDLELALDAAMELRPARIVVVGSDGGRLDHLLGALLLLTSDRYAAVEMDAVLGETRVLVVRSTRTLHGSAGDLLTLLPAHGPAEGVTTEGLAYSLRGETLPAGTTRGVSNVFSEPEARVSLARGVLVAVMPPAVQRS